MDQEKDQGNDQKSGWLKMINWDDKGLIPAIAQEAETGKLLMVAWMNSESLQLTVEEGRAIYWSRSRKKLWRKGEESGHEQIIKEIRLDCDNDVLLLQVDQKGGIACHTGRHNCFFKRLVDGEWQEVEPILQDPESIYKDK
ncbi:MAG: phosphoribosyl-AMP cyclohydrolase [Gammaproteobacteria bacterium]